MFSDRAKYRRKWKVHMVGTLTALANIVSVVGVGCDFGCIRQKKEKQQDSHNFHTMIGVSFKKLCVRL